MATLVLGAVGSAIGASIGGGILGVSAVTIGGFIGSTVGGMVDSWIVSSLAPAQRIDGARLDSLAVTSASEGAVIPRLFGRMRMGGNIIWATDFREETNTSSQGGGKGSGPKVTTTEYLYYASFAVALCEGPITGIGRVWADGKAMDMTGVTWRWYPGDEVQTPDPFISAKMGAASTPAYRGTAYVVFEELDLSAFGNRLPQISFEVFRPLADPDTAEGLVKAVTMIPASGEFSYATVPVKKTSGGSANLFGETSGGTTVTENLNALSDTADIVVSLDRLQAMAPAVESVSLVVAWFGDDLRAGFCRLRPGVEVTAKTTTPTSWSVNGVARADAFLVSRDAEDRPVYGGTPADFAVVQAIREIKARGLRVTFYPFLLMDVPPGNTLPNPYSDNAAGTGQPAFPWRGRITCSPAAGYAGSVDKTAMAATQVEALFGTTTPSDFSVSGESVSWIGASGEWGLRRMILHYAHLCKAAGGVDAFLIGSEMPGLTTIRSGAATYPAVQALRDLAADVRSILGAGPRIGYAADWSEYFGHQPGDGSGDVFFHLDPLWADPEIDFIGIDNYMPLSDWRDGFEHADAALAPAIYDRAYLQGNIAGGEGFDWFYASPADRVVQIRTPITDGSVGKPWVFCFKDLRAWWTKPHYNRIGQVVPVMAGGTVSTITDSIDGQDYFVHTFTDSGTLTVSTETEVEVLVVGGGGGGSTGGGGAGGIVRERFTLSAGTWPVTVGAGGAGIHGGALPRPTPGANGADSSFVGLIALGGGGGAGTDYNGIDGGSGGGAASSSKPLNPSNGGAGLQPGAASGGSGFAGGAVTRFSTPYFAGGGGGAGGAGQTEAGAWTAGGIGITTTIMGPVQGIGGGGAGGNWTGGTGLAGTHGGGSGGSSSARDGAANTGGGGGGGSMTATGGTGGSGLVVIRYLAPPPRPVEDDEPTAWVPQSKPIWFTETGCPAIDRGTNQPNVFFDPKSSESFTPHFSRGWRDDAIQRAYLEAICLWWGTPANNPVSSVYGDRMVHVPECAAWTWDARPYPFFPALTDVWTDSANWRLGHWLTGRLGAVSLAALVRHLCLRAGMREELIDVSGLWGAVEGYVISALEAPRASISTLARHFGFDAVESEGRIKFLMRGRIASTTVTPDGMVAPSSAQGDVMELTRAQETELPQALKWQLARADEDYDAAQVEARRITVDTARIASESFPMAVPPEEAERRCRRALMEAWVGRESAVFRLPPSRLALDPCDVILLDHDGRQTEMRLVSIADSDLRSIDAVRQDRTVYDFPPGEPRPASLSTPTVFGAPEVVLLDLPQLREDQPAHRPFIAAHAKPWPGEIAVFRSPATDGFALLTTFGSRARMGVLVSDLYAGPTSRFDLGNALVVDLYSGTLESVTDLTLLGGANALAVETAPSQWEIVQAGTAELIAPGRYRLTRLLRGQRGTEGAMGNPAPSGARVVVLDTALASLPIAEADLGLPWNWRIGPASRPVSDETYVAQAFTPVGVGLRPFSIAHVEQPWRTPRSPGDLTIRWTRRSRSLAADTWGAGDVPLAEDSEAYEVQILDGAAVKRMLGTTTTSVTYTAAQQTADWGAPLGPGDGLDVRIYQLSALIGRGAAKTITLTF